MRASAGVSALALPPAQAVGPEALDTVLQKPATVSRMVDAELSASQTFHASTAGIQGSEPSCADFADVGLDQVFNANLGTRVAYRGQSSQKFASEARYSLKQAVGVFNSPTASVDPVVALIFMSDCYGHPMTVTDGQGVTDAWTSTQKSSSDGTAGWSMTHEANDRSCYVEMRARQEVMFHVKVCLPRSGERAAARIADAMEAVV